MKLMNSLLIIGVTSLSLVASAQMTQYDADYDQSNPLDCGTLAAGGTNYVDQVGPYLPNTDETIVFCPDLAQGSKVSIAFATNIGYVFDIHPSDTLYIYDGPSISSPLIGAYNSGTNPMAMNVQASFVNNPSGCLTTRFRSDGANETEGWVAKVACGDLAQPFYPHLEAFVNGSSTNVLNPLDTGYVNVCLGDSILLVAKPDFPYSLENAGTGYSQTIDNCNYNWTIGGVGTLPVNNDSVWFVPPARQGYFVDLRIQDIFPQNQRITCKVRVSQLPSFAGTGPVEDTVCLGMNTNLLGGVTSTDTVGVEVPEGTFPIGGTFAGLTFLPDGTGQQYTTSVEITGLGPGTVQNISDIQSICLDIEHSYIGDIEIGLTCPNGTMVSLANTYGGNGLFTGGCFGGGVFLGNDTDQDGGAPGTPVETYCFSPTAATFGTMCNELTNTVVNAYGFSMLNPNGVYLPDGNFNAFIGCPLEGTWTITVQDNQGIDDGYIFQWGILFDASLYPDPETYQNVIVSDNWSNDPTIQGGQSDTAIVVIPTQTGPHSYTYNVVDDFGCHYDTTVVLYTLPQPTIFPDTLACNYTFYVSGTTAFDGGIWTAADTCIHFSDSSLLNPIITTTVPGTYTVTFTDNSCGTVLTADIFFQDWAYTVVLDTLVCAGTPVVITPFQPEQNLNYSWNVGSTSPVITANSAGDYILTVSNQCNSWSDTATISYKICEIDVPNIINTSSTVGNEAWFIKYDGIESYHVVIVNRWGATVFESTDPSKSWNGKTEGGNVVEEGTYFYTLEAVMQNAEVITKQGFIQVYH